MKLELIDWADSHSPLAHVWINPAELIHGVLKIRSIGWVIHECKHSLTLASSIPGDKESKSVSGVISIPKVAITRRRKLK